MFMCIQLCKLVLAKTSSTINSVVEKDGGNVCEYHKKRSSLIFCVEYLSRSFYSPIVLQFQDQLRHVSLSLLLLKSLQEGLEGALLLLISLKKQMILKKSVNWVEANQNNSLYYNIKQCIHLWQIFLYHKTRVGRIL